MKKSILIILFVLILIIAVVLINISNNNIKANAISKFNAEFEKYNDKTLTGADILTIINRAIDNNKEYKIEKDQNRKLY